MGKVPESQAQVEAVPGSTVVASAAVEVATPVHFTPRISVDLEGMTPQAREAVDKLTRRYVKELVAETGRIETAERMQTAEVPEVTSTMVHNAADALRRVPVGEPPPRSLVSVVLYILSGALLLAAGAAGSYLNSGWQYSLFISLAILAVASGAYVFWRRL